MNERPKVIKAITLWQPWAGLMAVGAKTIETRSWRTNHRGLLAIHAAKRVLKPGSMPEEFYQAVADSDPKGVTMNLGRVLVVVELVNCIPVGVAKIASPNYETEKLFGDFTVGRWAWITKMVHRFENPIVCKGKQGLWNWEVPQELLEVLKDGC